MTQVITDEEVVALAQALIRGQGPSTEAEITRLVQWAAKACIMNQIVALVLKGKLLVNTRDNPDDITLQLAPIEATVVGQ